ncbi:MAG: hypothetical protein KAQ79_19740, partial [Cyclobacteriaceae bacterium]|nr:hypothetical protein [Cyclobacteriaceae bacterium]
MKKVNISQVDALFSNMSYPIEFLFYFKEGFNTKKIRAALRKLSSIFWPMFGEYKNGIISFDSYSEENHFDEEIVNQEFNIPETEEDRFNVYSQFRLPDLRRLFFLKVIQFKNGTLLIPKMNHVAGDGYSYFYFLSVLALLSKYSLVPFKSSLISFIYKPHHRRTTLKDFTFKGVELKPLLQDNTFTIEIEEILRKEVQSIIDEVSSSKKLQISINDVLSAVAFKKVVGIQSKFFGEKVNLTIPIDVRRQIKEYGQRFFGNGIMLHTIKLEKEYVETSSIKEIAINIRKSMPSVSKESYNYYLTELEEILSEGKMDKFKPFDPR